ncbi:MAG: NAD(P)-dependent oxidoreductase [Herpetosiphonaceae bacterium]|nr:NAD(P)-dependent oxidoreductase [Herpetosiphonaceae bacterium]
MRIAVTGGSGGIGRAVTTLALEQAHHVVSIDRVAPPQAAQPNVVYIQAELTDYEAFEQALRGCDALVHMGAIPAPGHHPDHVVHNNNVVGSYNALRAAAQVGINRICQASSVNATGAAYSRSPRYDYFPLDEHHPTYNEDPYSLSKWICEEQGNSFARRYANMTIASLRFHWVVPERAMVLNSRANLSGGAAKHLWGYTTFDAAARACLLSLTPKFEGHEVFYIVAPDTASDTPSLELQQRFFPDVPVTGDLSDHRSFFDSTKAERLLGWKHDEQ